MAKLLTKGRFRNSNLKLFSIADKIRSVVVQVFTAQKETILQLHPVHFLIKFPPVGHMSGELCPKFRGGIPTLGRQ